MTCPSACAQPAPSTINASPAAFNMISTDMSMKIILRLTSTPVSPSTNRTPATINPISIGNVFMIHHFFVKSDVLLFSPAGPDDKRQRSRPSAAWRPIQLQAYMVHKVIIQPSWDLLLRLAIFLKEQQ